MMVSRLLLWRLFSPHAAVRWLAGFLLRFHSEPAGDPEVGP